MPKISRKEIYLAIVIFLTSTFSFAMGYISNRESNHSPIIIEKCSDQK